MTLSNPYNDAVRTCFERPDHAGDLQGEYAQTLVARASSSDRGMTVVLAVGISDGIIVEMRFRAWACPHLIAAAQTLCAERENGPTSGLRHFDVNGMLQQLAIPIEKTGRVLLLEDALHSLCRQHAKISDIDFEPG